MTPEKELELMRNLANIEKQTDVWYDKPKPLQTNVNLFDHQPLRTEELEACPNETPKYRHLTWEYCRGCGVDIGSQGVPVVPWAISFDLPKDEFLEYSGGSEPFGPIHLRGHADRLPFESGSLDFVYSSHVLEDFPEDERLPVMTEWARPVRTNGYLVVLVPERERWQHAVQVLGRVPNCAHKGEPELGDLSRYAETIGLEIVQERLTNLYKADYSILGVFRKP